MSFKARETTVLASRSISTVEVVTHHPAWLPGPSRPMTQQQCSGRSAARWSRACGLFVFANVDGPYIPRFVATVNLKTAVDMPGVFPSTEAREAQDSRASISGLLHVIHFVAAVGISCKVKQEWP